MNDRASNVGPFTFEIAVASLPKIYQQMEEWLDQPDTNKVLLLDECVNLFDLTKYILEFSHSRVLLKSLVNTPVGGLTYHYISAR